MQYGEEGDPALALAEECAEVVQIITKIKRFDGHWDEIPPGKVVTRWQMLKDEMGGTRLFEDVRGRTPGYITLEQAV